MSGDAYQAGHQAHGTIRPGKKTKVLLFQKSLDQEAEPQR
jgi:hypothetical protein